MKLQVVALVAIAGVAGAQDLRPGKWMLEIYRPDAPLDTKHIRVIEDGDTFTFLDSDGEVTYFEDARVVDGAIEFEHPAFQKTCRLTSRPEGEGWRGTCPPGHEPEFDAGLTITLRPPKEPSPPGGGGAEEGGAVNQGEPAKAPDPAPDQGAPTPVDG